MTLHEGGTSEVRLEGHLDTRWAATFDGLSLRHERDGTTTLHGPVIDQPELWEGRSSELNLRRANA